MKSQKFIVTRNDSKQTALKKAIGFGLELAKDTRLVLLTATKKSDALETLFGKSGLKKISKSGILNNITTSIESLNTYKFDKSGDVIIAIYLPYSSFDKIDSYKYASYIIAVEFVPGELDKWQKRWDALNIDKPDNKQPSIEISDILKIALDELSNLINGASMVSPRAEELAKTYILGFFKYGIELNISDIKSYLISTHNWQPEDANRFVNLIEKKQTGSFFQGGDKSRLKANYDRWMTKIDN